MMRKRRGSIQYCMFSPYWSTFLAIFHKRDGNPDTGEEFLKSRSPRFKVDQIKIVPKNVVFSDTRFMELPAGQQWQQFDE